MKSANLFSLAILFVVGTFLVSCNDPSPIGGALPGIEPIEGTLVEDFDLSSKVVDREAVTFSLAHKLKFNLCGNIEDPIFGDENTSFYAQALPPGFNVDLEGKTLDSVVLIMLYDTLYTMGDTTIEQHFIVEELDESFDVLEEYNSSQDFLVKSTALADKYFFATPNQNTVIERRDTAGLYDTLSPQLRIRLDNILGNTLLDMDSLAFKESDVLDDIFKGIKVHSDIDHAALLSFNLSSAVSKVNVYYSQGGANKGVFYIPFKPSSIKIQRFDLNKSSTLQEFVDNPVLGDSICFSEGMSGVSTEISFNDIDRLEGATINKAELIITEYDNIDADPFMEKIKFLAATKKEVVDDVTNYYYISDLQIALDNTNLAFYGGGAEMEEVNGEMVNVFRINITTYLQSMIDGELDSNTLYLEPIGKKQVPFRSSFYGAKHSQYPIKLRVIYTPSN